MTKYQSPPDIGDGKGEPSFASDPLVGKVLAERYSIGRVLGHGGMGTVYEARQIGLRRRVAIKVIHPELAHSSRMVERFRREALTTANLRHPNIVTVYDFGSLDQGTMFLAMEYLSGPPLDRWLVQNGPAPPDMALDIILPVCSALGAAHRAGVIHRDIKPSNIILPDPDVPHDVVRVVDFGIARLREAEDGGDLTGTTMLGTPKYISPEIASGSRADVGSDIYSLAVTAYEMLVGHPPFVGPTSGSILIQHITKDPARPSTLRPGLTDAFDEPLLRALAKSPSERFRSAPEFGEALSSALAGASPADAGHAPGQDRPAILVVEDDDDIRAFIGEFLKSCGYDVTVAADGIDALMRLGSRRFDLILSDIDMPNLDGFTLLELKSQKGIDTPVVFMTAKVGDEHELHGFELGAEDYLRKPLTPAVLKARVDRILSRK